MKDVKTADRANLIERTALKATATKAPASTTPAATRTEPTRLAERSEASTLEVWQPVELSQKARNLADSEPAAPSSAAADSASDGADILGPIGDLLGLGGDDSLRAEDKDEDATIAVFDNFRDADAEGVTTHGELVEGVIQQEGGFDDEDIQRFQISGGGRFSDLKDGLADDDEDALETFVEDRVSGLLDNTSDGLEEILDDEDSQITTINQSQSQAEARVAREIWDETKEDPEFRADLARSLGLPDDVSDEELAQALTDEVDDIVENSDDIAEAKERYDELSAEAAERGIVHVVTSGNLGSFAAELDSLGVEVDDDFFDSVLVNEHTTVVAATDDNMTDSPKDDSGAGFNSPNAEAEIAAPGVDIEITTQDGATESANGTSFAAPMVAAAAASLAEEHPELSPEEIEEILVETATDIMEPESDVGGGVLNTDAALEEADNPDQEEPQWVKYLKEAVVDFLERAA